MAVLRRAVGLAAIVLVASVSTVLAQRKQPPPTPEWQFSVTPYAWLAGLEGRVGVGPVAANIDLSVGDLLKILRFAATGYLEARYARYVMGLDVIYVSIGDAKTIAFRGDTGSLNFSQRETILHPVVGYAFGNDSLGVDALVGVRIWHMSADLEVHGPRRSNERSGERTWGDATTGLRAHWIPAKHFRVLGAADVGGGGARHDWQALAAAGYDVGRWWNVGLGYRYLSIDYDRSRYLNDTNSRGFFLYGTYRF